jgi:hypothetical protein
MEKILLKKKISLNVKKFNLKIKKILIFNKKNILK